MSDMVLNKTATEFTEIKEEIQGVPDKTDVTKMVSHLFGPSLCFSLRSRLKRLLLVAALREQLPF